MIKIPSLWIFDLAFAHVRKSMTFSYILWNQLFSNLITPFLLIAVFNHQFNLILVIDKEVKAIKIISVKRLRVIDLKQPEDMIRHIWPLFCFT